jgi:mannose-6-phosphate isomerase-like protein (cupin superfamily)
MMLASTASSQQNFPVTPSGGPESAKLALTHDPTKATLITAADVAAAVGRLPAAGVSVNGTFVERVDAPGKLAYRILVARRGTPLNANRHATEAELWSIVDGSGTITTGGKIVETKKDGKVVSRVIDGGVTHKVTKGDFLVIPEGVPHYVTEANPHVIFLAIEFLRPEAPVKP